MPEEEHLYLDLLLDPEVALYLPKRTRAENAEMFRTTITQYALQNALNRWGIFDLNNNDFMGMCLMRTFDAEDVLEVGYSFHRKYWGKGLATEVVKSFIAYCFKELNARKIVAITSLENIASQKVLLKAGLKKAGNVNRYDAEVAYFEMENADFTDL